MPAFPTNSEELPAGPVPRHGFQGDRAEREPDRYPEGLCVALTRESGARGGTIAERVGRKLGWPVYGQEMLEYLAANEIARGQLLADLPPEAIDWANGRVEHLYRTGSLGGEPAFADLARLMFTLAASGEVVFVGRGAGYLLPPAATLHVRVIAPAADRVAYMAQYLRHSHEEAAEQVRRRDALRAEFVVTHFRRPAGDPHSFDLVLNSGMLGEEICAELIAQAARLKRSRLPAA
jgi:hypothetical protein